MFRPARDRIRREHSISSAAAARDVRPAEHLFARNGSPKNVGPNVSARAINLRLAPLWLLAAGQVPGAFIAGGTSFISFRRRSVMGARGQGARQRGRASGLEGENNANLAGPQKPIWMQLGYPMTMTMMMMMLAMAMARKL